MSAHEDIARLVREATAVIKTDARGAVAKLEEAYQLARGAGDDAESAAVAEELARAYPRRKSAARALYYARKSTALAPERKAAWTTLAKTCELYAARISDPRKGARSRALFRAAAAAFKQAASLTKDPEDRRWLLELARDAGRAGKPTA